MYNFKTNELIEAVLYHKTSIKSWFKYRALLWKIKKSTPDYNTLETIYEFIDQLNFAYFACLNEENKLFIGNSRKGKEKITERSLVYKDNTVKIAIILKASNTVTLHIERYMGYPQTSITFSDGQVDLKNKLEEQLFINCTNLIMNELYRMIKKYRRFGRL